MLAITLRHRPSRTTSSESKRLTGAARIILRLSVLAWLVPPALGQAPQITSAGVVNAASYAPSRLPCPPNWPERRSPWMDFRHPRDPMTMEVSPGPNHVTSLAAPGITEGIQISWTYRYIFGSINPGP